jgi:hypothetical protein
LRKNIAIPPSNTCSYISSSNVCSYTSSSNTLATFLLTIHVAILPLAIPVATSLAKFVAIIPLAIPVATSLAKFVAIIPLAISVATSLAKFVAILPLAISVATIRFMGNLSIQIPFTSVCLSVSSFALCGIPFLAGFYSKDLILELPTAISVAMLSISLVALAIVVAIFLQQYL